MKSRTRKKDNVKHSYVVRCNDLIKADHREEAANVLNEGIEYYTRLLTESICPFKVADSGLIAGCLRNLATTLEENTPGAKGLSDYIMANRRKKAKNQKVVNMSAFRRH